MSAPSLLPHLPPAGTTDTDVILNAFLEAVGGKGLALYPAQEEALLELLAGKHVILKTPTGSGKSLVALGLHFLTMSLGLRTVYTAPIKALVSEKFFALCNDFGAPYVGMMTGDATINRDAPILCCTAEVLANLALTGAHEQPGQQIHSVVMDEFHYYGDAERGMAWQVPLLLLRNTQFLLMSATLGDTDPIETALVARSKRPLAVVSSGDRPVPLEFDYVETPLHETLEGLVARHQAPVYIVHFTQREAAEQAQNLMSVQLSNKETKERIAEQLKGVRFDTPYGKDVQRFLRHGVGLHHAGLLPRYRLLVEQLAQQGLLKVICGTDTLGVGVNIPIRTVLFTKLAKFDGENTGILTARDFKQIAGRAGRKGFDDRGWVVAQAPEHIIENKRAEQRFTTGETKKRPTKKSPEPGFVSWDKNTFQRLVDKPPEALQSRFSIQHGTMMALLQSSSSGDGYKSLVELVQLSHDPPEKKRRHLVRARQLFLALRDAGLVQVQKRTSGGGQCVRCTENLQLEFSLHQALSLYLVETAFLLDPASETYALDLLTLTESVLENPKQILIRQQDKARNALYHQLKAEGVEYDELKAKLDEVTWPKPNADFIYDTFNAFALKHPWVKDGGNAAENIRPKSIVRDMIEQYLSFNEYIKEYGLERSEGLLLRYLSDAYKTLLQTVPEARKDDRVIDIEATLRVLIARVDSSLVDEWETLARGGRADKPLAEVLPPGTRLRVMPDADPRAFRARVRAEMHRLLKALAADDYDDAAAGLPVGDAPPTAATLRELFAPFLAVHGKVLFGPEARRPALTLVDDAGGGLYRVRQVLLDGAGDNDWFIEARVDATTARTVDEPLVELVSVGS